LKRVKLEKGKTLKGDAERLLKLKARGKSGENENNQTKLKRRINTED
jgi:hypothetical protein